MKRYEQLAQLLRQQIEQHHLRSGDPLPSLRAMRQQSGYSKNTVIRAYQELENDGLIEPRQRSGFVVRSTQSIQPQQISQPRKVALGAMPLQVLAAATDGTRVAFGSAHPAIENPACRAFYQTLARQAHRHAHPSKPYSHYVHPPGNLELRQQISRRMVNHQQNMTADDLIITNGAQEAISMALLSTAKAGDIIAVESPCFYGTLSCIEALGMKVLEIPSHPETGIDLCKLQQSLEEWPIKVLLLNPNLNNPVGFTMPDSHKQDLLKLTAPYDLPIIEDDTFGELYYSQKPNPLKSFDTEQRVIYCSSLSKVLNSDIRIGWVAPGRYFEQVNFQKCVMTMASPGVMQQAAADFLKDNRFERHLRRMRSTYQKQWQAFRDALYQYWPKPFTLNPPEGSYLCWVELSTGTDCDWIFQQAHQQKISITPGSLFSASGHYKNCIRLNFSTFTGSDIQLEALQTLGQLIEQAQSHSG